MLSFSLIKGEMYKIYKSKSFLMTLVLIIIILAISSFITFSQKENNDSWQHQLKVQIKGDQTLLSNASTTDKKYTENLKNEITLNNYRIEHNIPPTDKTFFGFLKKYAGITSFLGIVIMFYASSIFSKETSWGTLRMLLIRPYSRLNILLSKYATLLLFGLFLYVFTLLLLLISASILFGFHGLQLSDLTISNGEVVKFSLVNNILKQFLFDYFALSAYAALALMISVMFKNSAVSIATTLFLFLSGGTISSFFQNKSWSKFLFFSNTDMVSIQTKQAFSNTQSILFSVTIVFVYIVIFLGISTFIFNKKEYN